MRLVSGILVRRVLRQPLLTALLFFMTIRPAMSTESMNTVSYVDLNRFMGDWYVIACIPTLIERESYNAVESYRLDEDGTIATTFTFLKGGFDGRRKTYHPRGFVLDKQTNARWGMQFIWPIKADFRIVYLDQRYSQTIIAREKRDFVWLMARKPEMADSDYEEHMRRIMNLGYDIKEIRKVPQRWNIP